MNTTDDNWGARAIAHAQVIAKTGRGSATKAEARAAEYARSRLAELGITNLYLQSFRGLRSIWLFLAMAFGYALLGHAAYYLLASPLGMVPALGVMILAFGFCGYLLWRKFTFRDYLFRSRLPHGSSQNVIGVIPPTDEVRQKVVLVAHLDSHRAVYWFATDWLVWLYARLTPFVFYSLALAPLLYILAFLTQITAFSWAALAFALLHFLVWFTGSTADLGPYSPGANDNAAAVGTVLALAERLSREPLAHTEVWLALTGCEETGCDGMIALLHEHEGELKEAWFVDFELVGIGDRLVYLQNEGLARKRSVPAEVERLVQAAGAPFAIQPVNAGSAAAFTEAGVAWERGLKAVCLMTLRSESSLLPEWHRLTDTADRLQPEAMGRMNDCAWALLRQIDSV